MSLQFASAHTDKFLQFSNHQCNLILMNKEDNRHDLTNFTMCFHLYTFKKLYTTVKLRILQIRFVNVTYFMIAIHLFLSVEH